MELALGRALQLFLNFLKGGFPRVFGVGDLRPTARPWGAAGAMGGGEAEEGSRPDAARRAVCCGLGAET